MKKGDIVKVSDFSYCRSVENGKLSNDFHAFHPRCRDQFIVVETGCVFPRTSTWPGKNHNNDTVIQSQNSGLVVFIESQFLRPVTHTIIIDGKTIKLSHQSYESLKKQLTQ